MKAVSQDAVGMLQAFLMYMVSKPKDVSVV